jgi:Flp pilus assembly protein TadD
MMRERRSTVPRTIGMLLLASAVTVALAATAARAEKLVFTKDGTGSELARQSVKLCLDAMKQSDDARTATLEHGLAVAQQAVSADERDAKAHFAIFCNLGRKLEAQGASLAGLSNVKYLFGELDRAIALQPGFVDAYTAKGALLVRLPRLLGGDPDEGERLIRHAVALAPDHPTARLQLVKALLEKGNEDEARSEVRTVVTLADGVAAPPR